MEGTHGEAEHDDVCLCVAEGAEAVELFLPWGRLCWSGAVVGVLGGRGKGEEGRTHTGGVPEAEFDELVVDVEVVHVVFEHGGLAVWAVGEWRWVTESGGGGRQQRG